jgi:hypothetical protein
LPNRVGDQPRFGLVRQYTVGGGGNARPPAFLVPGRSEEGADARVGYLAMLGGLRGGPDFCAAKPCPLLVFNRSWALTLLYYPLPHHILSALVLT